MASPPARTHHRHCDRRSGPDAGLSHPRSFAISERSIDRLRPSHDPNFNPLVLDQNQGDADRCGASPNEGVDTRLIQDFPGHVDIRHTAHYTATVSPQTGGRQGQVSGAMRAHRASGDRIKKVSLGDWPQQ